MARKPTKDPLASIDEALGGGAQGGGSAEDLRDAYNDPNVREDDEEGGFDDEPLENEGEQPPLEHEDDLEPRVRGRAISRADAPMLSLGSFGQVTAARFYKHLDTGKIVIIGDAPVGITLSEFMRKFWAHMPKVGDGPAQFYARGLDATGRSCTQEEAIDPIDPQHTFLQQLRDQGYGEGTLGGGVKGLDQLASMAAVLSQLTEPERKRVEAQAAELTAQREAAAKREQAALDASMKLGEKYIDGMAAQAQSAAAEAESRARHAIESERSRASEHVQIIEKTANTAISMTSENAKTMAEMYRADAQKAIAEAQSSVAIAKADGDARVAQIKAEGDARLSIIRAEAQANESRMRLEMEAREKAEERKHLERMAEIKSEREARAQETNNLLQVRLATVNGQAQNPANMLNMGLDLLKQFGTNPKDALAAITGGGTAELVGPAIDAFAKISTGLIESIPKGIEAYMKQNTEREKLALQKKQMEAGMAPALGFGYAPVVQPAGLIAAASAARDVTPPPQAAPAQPNPQNLVPVEVTPPGAPAAPPPAAPAAPTSKLSLPEQKAARQAAEAVVDALKVQDTARWVSTLVDYYQRIPALMQYLRERGLPAVLREGGAPDALIAAFLALPAVASDIPADIPRS